jgi:hypothetical protein
MQELAVSESFIRLQFNNPCQLLFCTSPFSFCAIPRIVDEELYFNGVLVDEVCWASLSSWCLFDSCPGFISCFSHFLQSGFLIPDDSVWYPRYVLVSRRT